MEVNNQRFHDRIRGHKQRGRRWSALAHAIHPTVVEEKILRQIRDRDQL